MTLPKHLYRVDFCIGLGGSPKPTRFEYTHRTFDNLGDAMQQVRVMEKWPVHYELLGFHRAECVWHEINTRAVGGAS